MPEKDSKFGKKKVKCKSGSKAIPKNKKLYSSVTRKVKKSVKVWPSAYASGQVVTKYLKEGGKYKCKKNAMGDSKFYKPGSENALFLTPGIRECLSVIYGEKILLDPFRFGSNNLSRWFKEKWVNVCEKKKTPCGSGKKSKYCRPTVRVSSKTPRTVKEIPKSKLKKLCAQKRKNPSKKVYV